MNKKVTLQSPKAFWDQGISAVQNAR